MDHSSNLWARRDGGDVPMRMLVGLIVLLPVTVFFFIKWKKAVEETERLKASELVNRSITDDVSKKLAQAEAITSSYIEENKQLRALLGEAYTAMKQRDEEYGFDVLAAESFAFTQRMRDLGIVR